MNLKGEKKCVTWIATKSTKLHYYKVTWYFDKLNDVYTNSSTVGETFWVVSSKQQMRYGNLYIALSLYYLIELVQDNH